MQLQLILSQIRLFFLSFFTIKTKLRFKLLQNIVDFIQKGYQSQHSLKILQSPFMTETFWCNGYFLFCFQQRYVFLQWKFNSVKCMFRSWNESTVKKKRVEPQRDTAEIKVWEWGKQLWKSCLLSFFLIFINPIISVLYFTPQISSHYISMSKSSFKQIWLNHYFIISVLFFCDRIHGFFFAFCILPFLFRLSMCFNHKM